jgi:hypothetical protein
MSWDDLLTCLHEVRLPARRLLLDEARTRWERLNLERIREGRLLFVDVRKRRGIEEFAILPGGGSEADVLDRSRSIRHLLLRVRTPESTGRFLFGHDERHLFVLGLPEGRVRTLRDAFEILKPEVVHHAERAGERVLRQGEWFFVPVGEPDREGKVLEYARYDLGRRHIADEVLWIGPPVGEARVYARGAVRHRDHKTLRLRTWHRVMPNREDRKWAEPSGQQTGMVLGFRD